MKLENIKTDNDVLEFMKDNIKYGWLDYNGEEHINELKNVRKLYRTSSIADTLKHGIGTCIEQVHLMKVLLDSLGYPNKMFCTRVYEGEDFNDLESEEHMHCFLLYQRDDDNHIYQIEHPNWKRVGIYKYENEADALNQINDIYKKMSNGVVRSVTEFYEVPVGYSFKDFNLYINGLDEKKDTIK